MAPGGVRVVLLLGVGRACDAQAASRATRRRRLLLLSLPPRCREQSPTLTCPTLYHAHLLLLSARYAWAAGREPCSPELPALSPVSSLSVHAWDISAGSANVARRATYDHCSCHIERSVCILPYSLVRQTSFPACTLISRLLHHYAVSTLPLRGRCRRNCYLGFCYLFAPRASAIDLCIHSDGCAVTACLFWLPGVNMMTFVPGTLGVRAFFSRWYYCLLMLWRWEERL